MELKGLSLLKGKALELSDKISVIHPKISDIEEIGEEKYSELFSSLCATSIDVADILCFDLNIWYEDIKDEWEFFLQKCLIDSKEISVRIKYENFNIPILEEHCLAVGNSYRDALNFFLKLSGEYIILEKNINNIPQKIIYNVSPFYDGGNILYYILEEQTCFKFTKFFYEKTIKFLDTINWAKRDYEFLKGGSKGAKKYILRNTLYRQRKKTKKDIITLESIVSSLIAKGISYNEIWNLPIYSLYSIYYRLVKIDEYDNTMKALYSGCVDTKKNPINWEKVNWSTVIS